ERRRAAARAGGGGRPRPVERRGPVRHHPLRHVRAAARDRRDRAVPGGGAAVRGDPRADGRLAAAAPALVRVPRARPTRRRGRDPRVLLRRRDHLAHPRLRLRRRGERRPARGGGAGDRVRGAAHPGEVPVPRGGARDDRAVGDERGGGAGGFV
ncbi:MAG: 4-hydroxybenzoyl-CoA thioesterase family active site, partial [uncultured Gemmatimonadaceae bacterium]